MKINVAGAGAGKTTNLAVRVVDENVDKNKVVYVIAFTNSAVERISKKVEELCGGSVPKSIVIGTIHSFLYREFINPFYFILYGIHYKKISIVNLPSNPAFKQNLLSNLDNALNLHQSVIPQKAKWVVYKKSGDSKEIQIKRERVLGFFSKYCQKIYVDEAQDIDKDMMHIFTSLDSVGIDIEMFGDPKQDVKGYGCFQSLINDTNIVEYIRESHRCPAKHLLLSNTLASEPEKQFASKNNEKGCVTLYFETDLTALDEVINDQQFGLVYIQKKNDRVSTSSESLGKDHIFESVESEIHKALETKYQDLLTEKDISRRSYSVADCLMEAYKAGNGISDTLNNLVKYNRLNYDKVLWARLYELLNVETSGNQNIVQIIARSIESIKGLEDRNCLFILNGELAPYLFEPDKQEDNKNKHLLYVALTRSLQSLSILVLKEVENRYSKEQILKFFDVLLNGNKD